MTLDILTKYFKRPDGVTWRIDTDLIYPPFLARVTQALDLCDQQGAAYYPTRGTRSFAEQKRLYDAYQAKKAGKAVPAGMTGSRAAPPGSSAHQFGGAIDFAPDGDLGKAGLQANYALKNYKTLIDVCDIVGLVNGHTFNDAPHVQIPQLVSGRQLANTKAVYLKAAKGPTETMKQSNGLAAVWAYWDTLKLFEEYNG